MKLFIKTQTQECGMYDPSDLDDTNWIEAPKGTQAVYWSNFQDKPLFYKVDNSVLYVSDYHKWHLSAFTLNKLTTTLVLNHLWGTLQDFDL